MTMQESKAIYDAKGILMNLLMDEMQFTYVHEAIRCVLYRLDQRQWPKEERPRNLLPLNFLSDEYQDYLKDPAQHQEKLVGVLFK